MKIFVAHTLQQRELAHFVMATIGDLGHEPIDPIEPRSTPARITEALSAGIQDAECVVAIVRSEATRVYFALGLATALGKEALVIALHQSDIIAEVVTYPCVIIGADYLASESDVREALIRMVSAASRKAPSQKTSAAVEGTLASERHLVDSVSSWLKDSGIPFTGNDSATSPGPDLVARMPNGHVVVIEARGGPPQSRVSLETVRQLRSYMDRSQASKAILITSGSVTRAAEQLAEEEGIMVTSLPALLAHHSLATFLRTPIAPGYSNPALPPRAVAGFWLGRSESMRKEFFARPTGALLSVNGEDLYDGASHVCLDLVPVREAWLVVSERAIQTYRHLTGLSHGEEWRFIPHQSSEQDAVAFSASWEGPISWEDLLGPYGREAQTRAREDAAAIRLRVRRLP